MNEYLFLPLVRLGPQPLRAALKTERPASPGSTHDLPLERSARRAQLAAVGLSIAINAAALGLLQWELSEVAPRGEVHIIELGADSSSAYAQVAGHAHRSGAF